MLLLITQLPSTFADVDDTLEKIEECNNREIRFEWLSHLEFPAKHVIHDPNDEGCIIHEIWHWAGESTDDQWKHVYYYISYSADLCCG